MAQKQSDTDSNDISDEKTSLIHKRGILKGKLTRFNKFLDEWGPHVDKLQLESRLDKLNEIYEEYEEIQANIESLDPNDRSYEAEREGFENSYFSLKAKALSLLPRQIEIKPQQAVNVSNAPTTSVTRSPRLPQLELPSFSGKLEEFLPFWNLFDSLIHKNDSIQVIEKFYYLKSSLKGEALDLIQSLELISANYSIALDLIKQRYQNTRAIVQRHVKLLFEETQPLKRETSVGLKTLVDSANKHIRALQALSINTESWDPLLIHILTNKFDNATLRSWELENKTHTLPTFKQLTEFINHRCEMLDAIQSKLRLTDSVDSQKKPNKSCFLTYNTNCSLCKQHHYIYACSQFKGHTPAERLSHIRKAGLCINCLGKHKLSDCKASSCRICHKRHNTLLHLPSASQTQNYTNHKQHKDTARRQNFLSNNSNSNGIKPSISSKSDIEIQTGISKDNVPAQTSAATFLTKVQHKQTLLPTANILVKDNNGHLVQCRALLDSASHSHFISQACADKLKLPKQATNIHVTSINQNVTQSFHTVNLQFCSCHQTFTKWSIDCFIVQSIAENIPPIESVTSLDIPSNVKLADETYYESSQIDILIGAELFWKLLLTKSIQLSPNITLRDTKLGYIITGVIPVETMQQALQCNFTKTEIISQQLQQFWNVEELPDKIFLTQEQEYAELHYKNTVSRNEKGQYIVHLPQNNYAERISDSKSQALKRFHSLERRLNNNPELKHAYCQFLEEYLKLDHMELSPSDEHLRDFQKVYLPHHCVLKPSSTSTKLRVVFDGSAKSSSGISLNQTLINGPVVQAELFDIMIRFRLPKYCLTGDVEKMYRCVGVNSKQQHLQKILWRFSPEEPIQTYNLKTVTYGLVNSPFLATRTLLQLCEDEEDKFPLATRVIRNNTYVDDAILSGNTEDELISLQDEVQQLLHCGGFHMRKWCSNSQRVMEQIPVEEQASQNIFQPGKSDVVHTLGVGWHPESDQLRFCLDFQDKKPTKRNILSQISQIYDPLGLISPVITYAKIIMQQLWLNKLEWDEEISGSIAIKWDKFTTELSHLSLIHILRRALFTGNNMNIEMHVFSDASSQAYGTCIYLRSKTDKRWVVKLLTSKGKIAPIKQLSVPRLELCAAVLAVKLTTRVLTAMQIDECNVTFWCDSKIVLSWISRSPHYWQTFVANRVSMIQSFKHFKTWRYVPSDQNPADLVSRGTLPRTLQTSVLWWNGPNWLSQDNQCWPADSHLDSVQDIPEQKGVITLVNTVSAPVWWQRYSSLHKLIRVVAWCKRFIHNCRSSKQRRRSELSVEELDQAYIHIIKQVQHEEFNHEITKLAKGLEVENRSSIRSLNPFLDQNGLLRVGGRLQNALLSFEEKHPYILPEKHIITRLIVRTEHLKHLHAGAQTLLYIIRRRFWPINGKKIVNSVIKNCIVCFKNKPQSMTQLMGQLPGARVIPNRPFLYVGTDYTGPVLLKSSTLRNAKIIKAYIAIFICCATKAIHLELVSDLSTAAFLAAFQRFISRRGLCAHVFSDNGKCFVGANRELKEWKQLAMSSAFQEEVMRDAATKGIQWHFAPPYGSHFGGLYESNLKSMKYHLHRVMGNVKLTFEQLSTLLIQIEAILNSRPLTPLSNDPNDLRPLTAGHFLIGQELTAIPSPDLTSIPENKLSKWQHIQMLMQHFWQRWSKEYLNQLQCRKKWQVKTTNIQVGDLVLLKTVNPPLVWETGRVIKVYPGQDTLTRVVDVQTSKGNFRRPISKICPFPEQKN